jgi:hypothetical protein
LWAAVVALVRIHVGETLIRNSRPDDVSGYGTGRVSI